MKVTKCIICSYPKMRESDRHLLWQDVYDRLQAAGITLDDIEDDLDIWER